MARKLKIMENEIHPLDDLKNDEITKKREKLEMHTEEPGTPSMGVLFPILRRAKVSTLWSSFLSFMRLANCILYLEGQCLFL